MLRHSAAGYHLPDPHTEDPVETKPGHWATGRAVGVAVVAAGPSVMLDEEINSIPDTCLRGSLSGETLRCPFGGQTSLLVCIITSKTQL